MKTLRRILSAIITPPHLIARDKMLRDPDYHRVTIGQQRVERKINEVQARMNIIETQVAVLGRE